jgi:hypothetical protein
MSKGYRKIRPLYGGLEAWVAAGGETGVFVPPGVADAAESAMAAR